ncbi:CU044_5270 family protein [Actinomadura rupiterrae]|uniref:CU044_5270 family protein n=1 Tax=Actinomadura rupiterrae TaxID=559627 RepID=UPI0020A61B3E|nr:CU044_5270 family protein [Actinomadura rupiterrae]MCP2337813.1 hypothetical protein [Actinomadura rupiterrae]
MNDLMPPARRDLIDQDAVRTQLLRETRQTQRRTASQRWIFGGAAATAAAGVAVAAVAVVAPSGEKSPTLAPVAATEVLDRASKAAADGPDLNPRGNQYLYVESRSLHLDIGAKQPERTNRTDWASIDGKHASVANVTGGKDPLGEVWLCNGSADYERRAAEAKAAGHQPKVDLADPPKGCHNPPAILTGLPSDVKGMRAWLYRNSRGQNPSDVQAFLTLADTLRARYVRPSALTVLFKAAATIPGVTVSRGVADLAGRKGIAVGHTWNGRRVEVVFDAKTYRYLGERRLVDHGDRLPPTPGSLNTTPGHPNTTPGRPHTPPGRPQTPGQTTPPSKPESHTTPPSRQTTPPSRPGQTTPPSRPGGPAQTPNANVTPSVGPGVPDGTVLDMFVQLKIAITDAPGQQPS